MKLKIVNVELFEDDDDDNDLNDLTKYILYVHTLLYDHICHPQSHPKKKAPNLLFGSKFRDLK